MKICTNCGENLPDSAHFCPKCMHQFDKIEFYKEKKHKWKKTDWLIILAFIISYTGIGIYFTYTVGIPKFRMDVQTYLLEEEARARRKYEMAFPSYPASMENDYIDVDCRDMLITDYNTVKSKLGEETEEAYLEGDFEIHTFDNVIVWVNEEGYVWGIQIEYTEETDTEYGLFGIGRQAKYYEVREYLGIPVQDFGDELIYSYYEQVQTSFEITFSQDDTVQELLFYAV